MNNKDLLTKAGLTNDEADRVVSMIDQPTSTEARSLRRLLNQIVAAKLDTDPVKANKQLEEIEGKALQLLKPKVKERVSTFSHSRLGSLVLGGLGFLAVWLVSSFWGEGDGSKSVSYTHLTLPTTPYV